MSTRRSDQSSQEHFPPPAAVGLGVATDLQAALPCSRVISISEGSVVTTPSRADYRDGNMLYLREEPTASDCWEWRAAQVLAEHAVGHLQIAWEQPLDVEPVTLGKPFETSVDVVMTRRGMSSTRSDEAFVSVQTAEELDGVVELIKTCAAEEESPQDFADWYGTQIRDRVERGTARWFAMTDGSAIVASAGLVVTEQGLRFQEVQTHPRARRKGWATRLIGSMLSEVSDGEPTDCVLVTEKDGVAEAMYRKLGFERVSQLVSATAMADGSGASAGTSTLVDDDASKNSSGLEPL